MSGEDRSRPASTPGGSTSGLADRASSYRRPGLDRAVRVARRDWHGVGVSRAIRELAKTGRPFDADDVRVLVGEESDDARVFAASFAAAQRSGLIEVCGAIIDRRGRPCRVWVCSHAFLEEATS